MTVTPESVAGILAMSDDTIDRLIRQRAALVTALEAACGYLLNAKIDLETGAPKKTALQTIEGGLKLVRAALAEVKQ